VQPRTKISLDQRAACQHDVVIPTPDLANGTGDNYKFVALSVPIVPSTLQPTLSAVAHCFGPRIVAYCRGRSTARTHLLVHAAEGYRAFVEAKLPTERLRHLSYLHPIWSYFGGWRWHTKHL